MLTINTAVASKRLDLWPAENLPDKKIRDISFEISFKAFENKAIHAKVFWISNKRDVQLLGEYKKENEKKYIESINSKISLTVMSLPTLYSISKIVGCIKETVPPLKL